MMITLKNQYLTVEIDDLGAQLCSVKAPCGREYIWQADPAIWGRHAPLLFPVIGRLQGGQYSYAAAVGLVNKLINLTVLLIANRITKKLTSVGLT